MTTVETARGPVALDSIGTTLPHEHIFAKNPELEQNFPDPEWLGEDVMIQKAADVLNDLKGIGIDTVVDLTVPGLGRYVPRILEVAARTDVHLVLATGWYTFNTLPAYFHTHGPGLPIDGPDPLQTLFIRDITEGIADTGVKAAMIKVATDAPGITPELERVLFAAAVAHKETGATISTHTHVASFTGRDQQEYFKRQGIPLEHVVIGHSGDSEDISYLRELMDNGSTIGLDRFGMEMFLADEKRIDVLLELVGLGYSDRLTLSHDAGVFSINTPPSWRTRTHPDWRHDHITRRILPKARERGLSDEAIHQMMVLNPARILVGGRR